MLKCELYNSCNFYRKGFTAMPLTTKHLRKHYCLGNSRECARYQLAMDVGMASVPDYIYPNSFDLIESSARDMYRQSP
jgi:hypothetical protein